MKTITQPPAPLKRINTKINSLEQINPVLLLIHIFFFCESELGFKRNIETVFLLFSSKENFYDCDLHLDFTKKCFVEII